MRMPGNKKSDCVVAVSVGDPAGIGPEVAVAAARNESVLASCRPVLFWPRGVDGPGEGIESMAVGEQGDGPAASAMASLEAATEAVMSGTCQALVTAPLSKERVAQIVPGFTGHTDWLAERAGVRPEDVVMIFSGPRVRAACVTRHVALSRVPGILDGGQVAWATLLVWGHLRWDLGLEAPRVAVCGLNPHASDGGLMGREEEEIVAPAVDRAREAVSRLGGGSISGPVAADGAFRDHVLGKTDGVVAMYHDQATIAAKLADPFRCVNTTAGLPFVRTSPDHGTADDIAGTGSADPGGMREAVLAAARLASREGALRHHLDSLRSVL